MELWTKLTRQLFELIAHKISHWMSSPPEESYVERQNLIIAAKAVREAVHVTWTAE
jgi:hypothetical protein